MCKIFKFSAFFIATLLMSCNTYTYVQVVKTTPVVKNSSISCYDNGYLYEDANCAIIYSLWSEGGNTKFGIYNKTDEILYIDLSKSFFIKNGLAYNYYENRTYSETKSNNITQVSTSSISGTISASNSASISQSYLGDFGYLSNALTGPLTSSLSASAERAYSNNRGVSTSYAASTGQSVGVEWSEACIVGIPPHSSKIISEFTISNSDILDCDLVRYPSSSSSISYTVDNTPIVFSNYITYKVGESGKVNHVNNDFYVSEITNYPRPSIISFSEKAKQCPNLYPLRRVPSTVYSVYDAYVNIPIEGCFYIQYSIKSNNTLYKNNSGSYYWSPEDNGYIRGHYR